MRKPFQLIFSVLCKVLELSFLDELPVVQLLHNVLYLLHIVLHFVLGCLYIIALLICIALKNLNSTFLVIDVIQHSLERINLHKHLQPLLH